MRVVVLVVGVVIAGCAESPGLQLEVGVANTSISRVELIVAAPCADCPTEMAAPRLALRPTSIYASPHAEAWFADVEGTFAGFFLHVDGSEDERIAKLGVIGFDAAQRPIAYATLQDVRVPAHDELHWRIELKPIVPIDDNTMPASDDERVTVWRDPEQIEPSCMMVEHWHSGDATTTALVPAADPDCDHVLELECAPNIPDAMNVGATFSTASCMLVVPTSAAPVCMFGGATCTDGAPATATACTRLDEEHCLPAKLCDCAPADVGCLFGKFLTGTTDGTVTSFRCAVPITSEGALCPNATVAELDAKPLLTVGTNCKSIRFLENFLSAMALTDNTRFDADVDLTLASFRQPCAIDLGWQGTVMNPANMHTSIVAVDLEIDNGKHIDVPVRIDTVPNCNEPFVCQLAITPNDSVSLCGRPMF